MQAHLERLGRFHLDRARARFKAGFAPQFMRRIVVDGQMASVVSLKPHEAGLEVEHFYLYPQRQNSGLGGQVLRQLMDEADGRGLAIHLGVLKESPAAAFYERHGFERTHEDEWDIYFRRRVGDIPEGGND